jgi:hypothetical protein
MQTAYFVASHTGRLDRVLCEIRVTSDRAAKARKHVTFYVVCGWILLIVIIPISTVSVFCSNGAADIHLTPFVTYIPLPNYGLQIVRVVDVVFAVFLLAAWVFTQATNFMLATIFYQQFNDLNESYKCSIDDRGRFHGDLETFRQRHQILSSLVNESDSFFMISNVAGFCCQMATIIIVLYEVIFYPDMSTSADSAFVFYLLTTGNVFALTINVVEGLMVNHAVGAVSRSAKMK